VYLFQPKWIGGIEIATYNLAKNLAKNGHEVHIITSLDKGLPEVDNENGYIIHRIKRPNIRVAGSIIWFIKIIASLNKIRPEIIHCQGTVISIPAQVGNLLWKIPYVIQGHGTEEYYPTWYIKPLIRLALKDAAATIALTQDMKKAIQKIYSRDVLVVPNGIDLSQFLNISRNIVRERLLIKDDEKIILFVGTLHPVKGLRYLVCAMETIHENYPDVRLFLVGDGPERNELEHLVNSLNLMSCIKFVGRINNYNIPEYMVASDIFVLPSLSEGLPVVILEAMAGGLPIIASKVGGIPEIVIDGENGLLCEPKKSEQLAEYISCLMDSWELREKFSLNNKERIKYYNWENITAQLEGIYSGIIDKIPISGGSLKQHSRM
jgi:glycosyltransferase involved in cell wall biosynthesis